MKIKTEHVETMRAAISATLEKYPTIIQLYENGHFTGADKTGDLQKRFCFDLMFAAKLTPFVCDTIYSYANDAHLFTALKTICPKITRRY